MTRYRWPWRPLTRLDSTDAAFSQSFMCIWISCSRVVSSIILGRVGFVGLGVVCLTDMEDNIMVTGISGGFPCLLGNTLVC